MNQGCFPTKRLKSVTSIELKPDGPTNSADKTLIGLMDTSNPTGKLMLTMLGSIAAFEREIMLERQREGFAKAKAAGKYKGRKPSEGQGR